METSEIYSRQIIRAKNYASFTLTAGKRKRDFTVDFNVEVQETGKDINFMLLHYNEYKKWLNWLRHRYVTRNGVTVPVAMPVLKTIYKHRSNILEKTYRLGEGLFVLILDNTYSEITDKTVHVHIVSKWNIGAPVKDLPIINKEVIELPTEVYEVLQNANECYVSGHYEQSSVMFRKAIDFAIRLKLLQSGLGEADLMDKEGNELNLSKKIKLLHENDLVTQKTAKHIEDIKWYGDLGAHGKVRFVLEDISDNVEPKVRAFLTGLNLKI